MNNEFKQISKGDITRYVLESGSSGGTSSGSVASVSMPIGGTRKRGDNLIAQEADSKTVPTSTPRNFVAKNAKTSGAGAHKDKKKAAKQGQEKHKKPFMEDHTTASGGWGQGSYNTYTAGHHGRGVAEDERDHPDHEIQMASSELMSIAKNAEELLDMVRRYSEQEGLDAWQQSKITKAADYLNAVLQSISGEQQDQGVAEGERTMSRAAKGYEKYGKKGMMALAKAGRDGASDEKLDAIRDKHNHYNEEWSQKYKSSINCSHPKGFSQKAHCAGKKKHNEDMSMEAVCPDCGMCETHGDSMMEVKQRLDAKCWKGKHKEGTKIKGGIRVNNCVPNESVRESKERCPQCGMTNCSCAPGKCKCKPIAGWIPNKGFKKQEMDESWEDIKKFGKKAAVAGAIGLGIGAANAGGFPSDIPAGGHNQLPDIVAHVSFKVGDKEVSKDINLGSHYRSPGEAGEELKNFLNSKGIKFYNYKLERVQPKAGDKVDSSPATSDMKGSMDTSEPAATGPSTDNYMAKDNDPEHGPSMGGKFTKEGAKVDRQAKHITASMMKKGKSKKDAESIAWAHIKHPKNESADTYFESLQSMMERQLEPNMELDTWIDNFQHADPNKYHQFKNKTPEKKK